jgi:hypothetical protein
VLKLLQYNTNAKPLGPEQIAVALPQALVIQRFTQLFLYANSYKENL